MSTPKRLTPGQLAEHIANVNAWKDPPTAYYDDGVRYGTGPEMIARIKELQSQVDDADVRKSMIAWLIVRLREYITDAEICAGLERVKFAAALPAPAPRGEAAPDPSTGSA